MREKYNQAVLGIDYNQETILHNLSANRNVIHGDATDSDFWERVQPSSKIRLIILATSNHSTHMQVITQFKEICNEKMIAALSRYDDDIEELKQAGVQVVFNLYAEAGVGYAEQVYQIFNQQNHETR
jgi:Trk K+ transport system NAD-binding subunit